MHPPLPPPLSPVLAALLVLACVPKGRTPTPHSPPPRPPAATTDPAPPGTDDAAESESAPDDDAALSSDVMPHPREDHPREHLPEDLALRRLDEAPADGPAVPVATLRPRLPASARERLDQDGDESARRSVALHDGTPWSLVHERWGAVESTLFVIDDAGRVRSAKTFRIRVAMVGLADLWGDAALEVVVEVVEGTALSSWPRRWDLYRVTPDGRLALAGSLAKAYDYGAKSPSLYFHNTVTLPSKGTLRVETTVFEERGPEPPKGAPMGPGEVHELRWDSKTQRLRR